MERIGRIPAVVLALLMTLGLAGCSTDAAEYLAEVQAVSEWTCWETETTVEASFTPDNASELREVVEAAQAELSFTVQTDRQQSEGNIFGALSVDVSDLDVYGAQTDLQARYEMQPVYLQDSIVYAPVKLVHDLAEFEGIYVDGLQTLDAIEQEYIAIDSGLSEQNLAALDVLSTAALTLEQARELGGFLQDYTTDLRAQKNGRSYTLSGEIEQLPAELLQLYSFIFNNVQQIDDILGLGMDGETLASLLELAQELDNAQAEIEAMTDMMNEAGIEGSFSIKTTFADRTATERLGVTLTIRDWGTLELAVDSTTTHLNAIEQEIPDATEPMSAIELENLINGWTEENTPASAYIDLETGWMSTSYWDETPVYGYTECPLYMQNGEYLFGFRALMEGMGFGVDYDPDGDVIYFVDQTGGRTAMDLYELNGQSFITIDQLLELGFVTEIDTEWLTVSIEYQPGAEQSPLLQ